MELLQIITFRHNKNNYYLHFGKATEKNLVITIIKIRKSI